MTIRVDEILSEPGISFLFQCYKFVAVEWQHSKRELIPDQGFEQRFRESCSLKLSGWSISQAREMNLGCGLDTASAVAHEVDIVARFQNLTAILEVKNRQASPPGKNDVIVFFAKIFDYLAANPILVQKEVCLGFMSNTTFEPSGLAACLGLGIHPIAPGLRPIPILVKNAELMDYELKKGLKVTPNIFAQFQDFCAALNRMCLILDKTWLSSRCGYYSEDKIVLKAVSPLPTLELSQEIRQINGDCTRLLEEFRKAKSRVR